MWDTEKKNYYYSASAKSVKNHPVACLRSSASAKSSVKVLAVYFKMKRSIKPLFFKLVERNRRGGGGVEKGREMGEGEVGGVYSRP